MCFDVRSFGIKPQLRLADMKENTEYPELFIIVDNTKFQQGQKSKNNKLSWPFWNLVLSMISRHKSNE